MEEALYGDIPQARWLLGLVVSAVKGLSTAASFLYLGKKYLQGIRIIQCGSDLSHRKFKSLPDTFFLIFVFLHLLMGNATPDDIEEYYSPIFGLRFFHPTAWGIEENVGMGGLQIHIPPAEGNTNTSESFTILVRPQSEKISADPMVLSYIANELIRNNFENYKHFTLMSLMPGKHGDMQYREMTFAYNDEKNGKGMQATQNVFVNANKLYLLTFTAPEGTYRLFQELVRQIFLSIRVE
jgi:hypothetical protein